MRYPALVRSLATSLATALAFTASGCATMIHGSTQEVRIESEPQGAKVTIDGKDAGVTPVTVEMKRRGEPYTITYEKEGYIKDDHRTKVGQTTARLLNFLLYPFWGLGILTYGVDYKSGAQYSIEPNPVRYKLRDNPPPALLSDTPISVTWQPFVPKGGASPEKAGNASILFKTLIQSSGRFTIAENGAPAAYHLRGDLNWSEPAYTLSIELVDASNGKQVYWDQLQCDTDSVPDTATRLAGRTIKTLTPKPPPAAVPAASAAGAPETPAPLQPAPPAPGSGTTN